MNHIDKGNLKRREFLKSVGKIGKVGALVGASGLFSSSMGLARVEQYIGKVGVERDPAIHMDPPFLRKTLSTAGKIPQPVSWFPVMQGATSQTQTQFRICIESNRLVRYFIVDHNGKRREVSARSRFGIPTSQMIVDHVYVDGLEAGTSYTLEISRDGASEKRQFSTLAKQSGQGDPLRIALISCMNDRYQDEQAAMWAAVAKSTPEMMIFNGDCCYVDQRWDGTIEGMFHRHLETRLMLDVFKWDRLVPILTTWDDHDVGENDADSFSPNIGIAAQYFTAMFGSDPVDGMAVSGGRSYVFDINGMRFVLLDDRSSLMDGQVYSAEDENWIINQMKESPYPIFLVNGTQFLGGYLLGAESVEKYAPSQLARLLQEASQVSFPVALMSGDVHFSEIMELEKGILGYRSFEFTSSSIHSRTFPGQQYRSYNSRRLMSTSKHNFMAFEMSSPSAKEVQFEVASLGAKNEEYFRLSDKIIR